MGLRLIPNGTKIPFTNYRHVGMAVSALLVIASIVATMTIGLNFGIDFKGGITVEVGPADGQSFTEGDLTTVRTATANLGLGDVKVQTIDAPGAAAGKSPNIVVFVQRQTTDVAGLEGDALEAAERAAEVAQTDAKNAVLSALRETLGDGISVRREDVVGPTVSEELMGKGITALAIAVAMMLAYIWFRFEWQFSVGAIVALTHDVIVTVGFFSVTQLDFNLPIVAALLTIIGYSMNDTVVIYDRIRENLRKFKQMSLREHIDLSINQTLSRTLMTSGTTLIALLALLFLGGDVLRGFSIAIIWGIIIGTYSTIFVASPMLMLTGVTAVKGGRSTDVAKTPARAG